MRPARFPRSAWVPLLLLAACAEPSGGPGGALEVLERLAFVPPGECRLVARDVADIVCANTAALLVDRFEVDRLAWQTWLGSADLVDDPTRAEFVAGWDETEHAWPATGMTLAEAHAFAASRGMRLPTAAEWVRIAAGTRAQPWPWGATRATSVANTAELGLDRPVATGTFEQGQSPESVYDLIGNAAEWVDPPVPPPAGEEPGLVPLAWAMGGSYATRLWRIYEPDRRGRAGIFQMDLDPRSRSADVGLRCVADARVWLTAHADDLGSGARARQRLVAVGARWGRDAVPLLEELASRPGAPPALGARREGARR